MRGEFKICIKTLRFLYSKNPKTLIRPFFLNHDIKRQLSDWLWLCFEASW